MSYGLTSPSSGCSIFSAKKRNMKQVGLMNIFHQADLPHICQCVLCVDAARRTATEASKPMSSMQPATKSVQRLPSMNPEVIASAIFGASSPNWAAGPSPLRNERQPSC